ncbi:DUF748 domain-containing protein [Algoriphagus sediminis]|uniref:DUF748 domain-containing protein n=1 Tax=Algoriphagus sediminis TaxID=3057113 RepID=A0ABT7Y894_9BACT|nr:DUF748 domain-containing protein [Algoriphagus sediminis]MDN3202693.1 DUF748 domain-containing protein [Algoriphagus sediminis]
MSLPKKRKNFKIKITAVILLVVIGGFLLLKHFVVNQFEKRFEETINSNPDRAYDIRYESFSFDLVKTQVKMEGITIIPINVDSTTSNTIEGSVDLALLNGVGVIDFLLNQSLTIDELRFEAPKFTLVHSKREQASKSSGSFQDLFKDIVSRGEIKNFTLSEGEATLFIKNDTLRQIGSFEGFQLEAKNLATDIERLNYAIPFQFNDLHTAFRNLEMEISEGEILRLGNFEFDYGNERLHLADFSLTHDRDWKEVAREEEFQKDIIDFSVQSITLSKVNPLSSLYNSLVVIAEKVEIDSLVLNDGRDKNIPRPPDVVKQNYAAMLKALDIPIRINSVAIKNSKVTYSEINIGSSSPGTLVLENVNCKLYNLSTIDSIEMKKPLQIELSALLNGEGKVNLIAKENYETMSVDAELTLGPMDMKSLNQTLINMAGVKVNEGRILGLKAQMNWDLKGSKNKFQIEYDNLEIEILKSNSRKENKFLSTVGKAAYHKSHIQSDKHYQEPEYYSYRNIYRGPFNFLWVNVKDGVFQTVPSGVARMFIPKPEKQD